MIKIDSLINCHTTYKGISIHWLIRYKSAENQKQQLKLLPKKKTFKKTVWSGSLNDQNERTTKIKKPLSDGWFRTTIVQQRGTPHKVPLSIIYQRVESNCIRWLGWLVIIRNALVKQYQNVRVFWPLCLGFLLVLLFLIHNYTLVEFAFEALQKLSVQ